MTTKILVMGLPGAGKTTFSQNLVKRLMINHTVSWYNADTVREMFDDWDFTPEGRTRQVKRMAELADNCKSEFVICDFVCPTEETRKLFDADVVVWMDTIAEGRYEDTNKMFVPPTKFHFRVITWSEDWVKSVVDYLTISGDTHRRSLLKAVSWRVLGTLDTFLLSWLITGRVDMAAAIGGTEVITKMILYYLHERAWTKVKMR